MTYDPNKRYRDKFGSEVKVFAKLQHYTGKWYWFAAIKINGGWRQTLWLEDEIDLEEWPEEKQVWVSAEHGSSHTSTIRSQESATRVAAIGYDYTVYGPFTLSEETRWSGGSE